MTGELIAITRALGVNFKVLQQKENGDLTIVAPSPKKVKGTKKKRGR